MINKLTKKFNLNQILLTGLVLRLIAIFFLADEKLTNEWAIIIHNYEISGIFGFHVAISDFFATPKFSEPGEKVLPTVFMPPLYFYFLSAVKFLTFGQINFVKAVLYFQLLFGLSSIIIFYKIVKCLENKSLAILATSVFGFFPLNIYAVSQISSITIQILLILSFIFFLIKFIEKKNYNYFIFFSIISGLLILTRGEFFIFYLLTLIYFFIFLKKKFKYFFISIIITIITIGPYIYKNYYLFNTFVITKSFGYNLLKGNNPNLKIEGDPNFIEQVYNKNNQKIKTNNNYEIELDNFYRDKSLDIILENPKKYILFYFKKLFAFKFFDLNSSYPNYYNLFHLIPKIIISILALLGSFIIFKKKGIYQYLFLYYYTNILLFSVFFILPRYSLILLPVQILVCVPFFKFTLRKFFN